MASVMIEITEMSSTKDEKSNAEVDELGEARKR